VVTIQAAPDSEVPRWWSSCFPLADAPLPAWYERLAAAKTEAVAVKSA